jgi:hypothetical protein
VFSDCFLLLDIVANLIDMLMSGKVGQVITVVEHRVEGKVKSSSCIFGEVGTIVEGKVGAREKH